MSDERILKKAENLKGCYNVCSVVNGFNYYVHMLTEKCLGMYKYDNCPRSLPQEQIERQLITKGFALIFKDKRFGLVTAPASLSGIDKYYMPTTAQYTQTVLGSGTLYIGKNCVVVYNSDIDQYEPMGLMPLIERYARILADIDSTIANLVINSRSQKMGLAKSSNSATALKNAIQSIYNGEPATINTQTFIEMVKTLDWNDNTNLGMNLDKLFANKARALGDFLQEVGVKTAFEKQERLITSEVSAGDQLLTVNTDDLTYFRKKGFADVNRMFNTNIIPRHNSAYFVNPWTTRTKGDNKNVQND